MKHILSFFSLRKSISYVGIMCLFLTYSSFGQDIISENHPLAVASPHIPTMLRYDNTGKIFYAEKFKYKSAENEKNLKTWVETYPDEVSTYKVAIIKYLNATDVSILPEPELNLYYDLKAQWTMASQMFNWMDR